MFWCLSFVFKGAKSRKRKILRPTRVSILFFLLMSGLKDDWKKRYRVRAGLK